MKFVVVGIASSSSYQYKSIVNDPYLSGGSSTKVVGSTLAEEDFVMEFNQTGEQEHLGLSPSGNSLPRLKTLGGDGGKGSIGGEVSRKVKTGTDSPPSDKLVY